MTDRVIDEYQRETVDFIPMRLAVVGAPVDSSLVEYAVVPERARPLAWSDVEVVDGQIGFTLNGPLLGRGVFCVYARVNVTPGPTVLKLGRFRLI